MYSKRKLRTFEETIGGSFNLKICIDKERFRADLFLFLLTSIFRIVLVKFGLSWQHNLYSQIKYQMVQLKVFMIAKSKLNTYF